MTDKKHIVVAGASGHLGLMIARQILARGANVTALTRSSKQRKTTEALTQLGAKIVEVDYDDHAGLTKACSGAHCVVSALSGLRDVIVEAQTSLLHAAVEARAKRFIPSDFCMDYRPLQPGTNRNLDLRREFSLILDSTPIKSTSILNGMFTHLLGDEAPVILAQQNRIFFWGMPIKKWILLRSRIQRNLQQKLPLMIPRHDGFALQVSRPPCAT
jgi:uncharacterized protein YbjT (DUF2867 family)